MFADDVMVFFDGGCSSLHGITEALDDFASWSGLEMKREKTNLFLAGVDNCEKYSITRFGISSSTLAIRYMGLSLMNRKLRISEYATLLEKITIRFIKWAVKSLSLLVGSN